MTTAKLFIGAPENVMSFLVKWSSKRLSKGIPRTSLRPRSTKGLHRKDYESDFFC